MRPEFFDETLLGLELHFDYAPSSGNPSYIISSLTPDFNFTTRNFGVDYIDHV